jgi:isopenicillin-N epimerase
MSTRRQFMRRLAVGGGYAAAMMNSNAIAVVMEAASELSPEDTPEQVAEQEWFWSRIQSAFTLDRTIIHLNSGGVSASPKTVHDALKRYLDHSNQAPSYYMWRHVRPGREGVRARLAQAFGCDKEEIAITRNTSEAMEIAQFGLDLNPGDEILATTQAYGRMLTTWEQRVRRDKIVLKKVMIPVPLMSDDDYVSRIEAAITPRTKVIMVMHVINITGQVTPVKKVCRIAHARGIPVMCDGAHSFSHFPFTVKDLDCDYYGTSLHKWTYAPVGTGFLYVQKDKIRETWPLMAANESQDNDIRKFEEIGTHPAANINAIAEALVFNEGIGIDRKAARLRHLHQRWIERLKKNDNVKFRVNIADPTQWCGVVNVHIEGTDITKLAAYLLEEHKIFLIAIGHPECKGLRITPNVYTTLSEIDLFAAAMEKVARGEVKSVLEN